MFMKLYVKYSDLLHFHGIFYDSSTELNTIHLTLTPCEFVFLSRIVGSFFTKKISLHIDKNIKVNIKPLSHLSSIDKDILKSFLDILDRQAILSKDGFISLHLMNSSHMLKVFEAFLSNSLPSHLTFEPDEDLILTKLFSIEKKLGYTNYKQEIRFLY